MVKVEKVTKEEAKKLADKAPQRRVGQWAKVCEQVIKSGDPDRDWETVRYHP